MKLSQILEDQGITMSARAAGYHADEDGWEHQLYICTLRRKVNGRSRSMTVRLRRGVALTEYPTLEEVVDTILLDSPLGVLFGDWCDDYGYDSDSIKALTIYRKCLTKERRARKFFGSSTFEQMLNSEHDM